MPQDHRDVQVQATGVEFRRFKAVPSYSQDWKAGESAVVTCGAETLRAGLDRNYPLAAYHSQRVTVLPNKRFGGPDTQPGDDGLVEVLLPFVVKGYDKTTMPILHSLLIRG